ncbi:Hypothetical predicted protein [Paramuricea clavata]|uniref:Uncharacterized protein n=1 Tax=Paramuricea clavata TaxID=317549 RepID=A0A6S7G8C8_PARCT|nr:Hypothetical predicted protein [Paramuricea clavata]
MLKVLITESHIRLRTYQRRIEEHRNAIFTTTNNTSDAKLLQDTINNITQEYQSKKRTEFKGNSIIQDHTNVTITTQTHAKKLDFIADLESALRNTELTEETKNNIHHQVTTNLLHLNHPIDLTKQEREALEDLKKDDDIVILPAYKGRMTVVMDKSDHNQ